MNSGIFIHWGIYSIPAFSPRRVKNKGNIYNGSEWYLGRMKKPFVYGKETIEYHKTHFEGVNYYDFLPMFEKESESWNAKQWISLFKKTKVEYVIFTVKHHDGVVMYPSKFGKYRTKRDYVGELVQLLKKENIKVGLYYSLMQWGIGKKGKNFENYVDNVLHPQLQEMVKNYEPDLIWADGDWTNTTKEWKSEQFLLWLYEFNSKIIVNSRWGNDFLSLRKDDIIKKISYLTTTDRFIPTEPMNDEWEHVNTIGLSWGYNKNQQDTDYKSVIELLKLCKKVKKLKGKFVINLGPKPNGDIENRELRIIEKINLRDCRPNYDNKYIKKCITLISKQYGIECDSIIQIINSMI